MIKRSFLVLVSVCLGLSSVLFVELSAHAQNPIDTKHIERIKQEAQAIGDGARVSIKLSSGKKLTGQINYVGDEFLQVTDEKTDASVKVPYSDVLQIERQKAKGRLSTKVKIALGVIGVLFVMGMIANGGE